MVYLTRKEHFNAAHKLWNPKWDEAKNFEVFGKCANVNWHGHNYDLLVTIKGKADPDTGFVMNVRDLGKLMRKHIVEELDHKNLNLDVPWLEGEMPTIEVLVIKIWERLANHLPNGMLHAVKLYETERIYAEYYGE